MIPTLVLYAVTLVYAVTKPLIKNNKTVQKKALWVYFGLFLESKLSQDKCLTSKR